MVPELEGVLNRCCIFRLRETRQAPFLIPPPNQVNTIKTDYIRASFTAVP